MVRPLLGLEREQIRELAAAAGLPFADDETNDDPAFARNRIRAEVLPVLRELNPAAERNIAETRAELAEEAALLERVVLEALDGAGAGAGAVAIAAEALAGCEPACGALRCAPSPSAPPVAPSLSGVAGPPRSCGWPARPEGGAVELGGGLVAVCESGHVRFARRRPSTPRPSPVALGLPGRARLGAWEVRAELHPAPGRPRRPRTWRPSTPRPFEAPSRCAPGARATASARSG